MKYSKLALIITLSLLLLSVTTTSAQDKQSQVADQQGRTLGERMVDFIRKILGEEQKPIDDDLVRDER